MLSVLIVNPCDASVIDGCLASIRQQIGAPCEVIVVGNAALDASTDRPGPSLIIPDDNRLNFAAAANLAAQRATGNYFLLLANDVVLLTGIDEATRIFENDPTIGVVGGEMYSHQGKYLTACALFPTPSRLFSFVRMWRVPVHTWKHIDGVAVRRCDYVDRAFLMVRASAWKSVDGMEPSNSLYGDEMDLCRTLLDAGYLTVQVPTIHYAHAGGYTPDRMAYLFGGFRRYHRRFSGRLTRLAAGLALRAGLILRLPLYWWKARGGDEQDRLALRCALEVHREWTSDGMKIAQATASNA